ncbi:STAS domain-containing protein [Synoicihabitans lomoniglobus]|uniref:STAS domain-containing protein n=1 Tax=Synoicihabitans lomoniglobus TaxID=2909285 RepID=A0AAF0I3N6_9BACT|nr:STAS domain-containing protein [Opitutaceae bacterium LMO-M01]WED66254.1 STAS domain-containing protein [Opitutaceae bacterium LMO-M01]
MSLNPEPRFLVNPDSDPIALRVEGKATFKNCACVKDFMDEQIAAGKRRFVMDFENCVGMDSTFLGVMAGSAIQLRKTQPRGSLVVSGLNERNRELVSNLGLDRLLTVDEQAKVPPTAANGAALKTEALSDDLVAARTVLDAHRNLVEADGENAAKFQDVIKLCSRQLGED